MGLGLNYGKLIFCARLSCVVVCELMASDHLPGNFATPKSSKFWQEFL